MDLRFDGDRPRQLGPRHPGGVQRERHAAPRLRHLGGGHGDLDSWNLPAGVQPIPPGVDGVAAGDYICRVLALRAGLAEPSSYRAWLSDSADDAFCRLLGLHGKKGTDCGQSDLVAAAGPWARTDDLAFAQSLLALTAGPGGASVVLSPARVNENGNGVTTLREVWTGTTTSGVAIASTCFDWQSSASHDSGALGSTVRTVDHWTSTTGAQDCDRARRLLCLQLGTGPAPPSPSRGGRFAFATSVIGTGDLGSWPDAGGQTGIAAGDAICRARAAAGGLALPDSFKAWLSDDDVDARDRFADGPWMRIDGFRLAGGLAALTDGELDTAIDRDELGSPVDESIQVWTGTAASGTRTADNCGEWTSDATGVDGRFGIAVSAAHEWTAANQLLFCAAPLRLYCLSDANPALLFADGFESGSTRLWGDDAHTTSSQSN